LLEVYPVDQVSSLLSVQYRMNETLMRFPSRYFYGGRVVADASAKNRKLSDLLEKEKAGGNQWSEILPIPGEITEAVCSDDPLVFINTAGLCPEKQKSGSSSRENPGEAYLALAIATRLMDRGVRADQIGIIAPYRDMVERLRMMRQTTDLEIHTVDGFQGREKEVIILSLVRSNQERYVGFLEDLRRLNVSITRARRKLVVIGDKETVSGDPMYAQWLESIARNGKVLSLTELGFVPPQDYSLGEFRTPENGNPAEPGGEETASEGAGMDAETPSRPRL
jgi:superfamily I DNA and/or RNA helicase